MTLYLAQTVKNLPAMLETQVRILGWEDLPGEGNGNPLQYSCLTGYRPWGGNWTRLSNFTFTLSCLREKYIKQYCTNFSYLKLNPYWFLHLPLSSFL